MEIKKTYIGKYFNKSAINLVKSRFIFFIVSLYEIYEVTIAIVTQQNTFFLLNKNRMLNQSKLNDILIQISPYFIYCKAKDMNDNFTSSSSYNANYNLAIVYLGLLLLFYLYLFFLTDKTRTEKKRF